MSIAARSGLVRGLHRGLYRGLNPWATVVAPATPIAATKLTSGSSTTDGTSVATGSFTPIANRPVYACVTARHTSNASSPEPTATGNSLTWTKVATIVNATNQRQHLFRALGASPTAGALTFDYGAETQTSFVWSIIQFANADTSGTNGSGATVQFATAVGSSVTAFPSPPTLLALGSALNAALCFVATAAQSTVTPDANFTELSDDNIATNTCTLEAQWAINQTVCNPTFGSTTATAIIIEVKAGT